MADDSLEITNPLDFDPTARPHGMKSFVQNDLTSEQRIKLNELQRNKLKQDHEYLASHPERGILFDIKMYNTQLCGRKSPKGRRPRRNLYEFVAEFFTKPKNDIQDSINEYLEERSKNISANSTILLHEELLYQEETDDLHKEIDYSQSASLPTVEETQGDIIITAPLTTKLSLDQEGDEESLIKVESLVASKEDNIEEIVEKKEVIAVESHDESKISKTEKILEQAMYEAMSPEDYCRHLLDRIVGNILGNEEDLSDLSGQIASLPSLTFIPEEYNDTQMPDSDEDDDYYDDDENSNLDAGNISDPEQ